MNNETIVKACHNVLGRAKDDSYNNCNYVLYKDEKEVLEHVGHACYSEIRAHSVSHLSLCIPHYKNIRFKNSLKEMKRLIFYLNWIIKKSPWKEAFLYPKQLPKTYFRDGLAMNTDKCPQYVVGAMSALRHAWEYPHFLDAWDKFQELGFSKETSFILANIMDKDGRLSNPNSNHATFQKDSLYKDNFLNFKKGIYPKWEKALPMNKNAEDYHGIFTLFIGGEKDSFNECLEPFCEKMGDGWFAKYSNKLSPEFVKAMKEFADE